MPKRIIIEIEDGGGVHVRAEGFRGKSCESATAAIEAALGEINQRQRTPEYFQTETVNQKQST